MKLSTVHIWKSIKKIYAFVFSRDLSYYITIHNFNCIEIVDSQQEKRQYSIIMESGLSRRVGHTKLISGHFQIEFTQIIIMMIIIVIDNIDNSQ